MPTRSQAHEKNIDSFLEMVVEPIERADEGQFLMLLLKLINAKNTIELGVYTGYSLLSTALALPRRQGALINMFMMSLKIYVFNLNMCLWLQIIAIGIHRQYYELGMLFFKRAGVHHKIDFREGHGLTMLEELLQDLSILHCEKHLGVFDFVFVDGDKDNYFNYHERFIKLVKVGRLIGYDNTLWQVSANMLDDDTYFQCVKHHKPFVLHFNKALTTDTRIEISMLTVGDGITLCRKITE
ncbi:hypothetical protein L7F22_038344 [Adiantum nelumboides]|nr:hypothetical protein [Adiantum nelumboides]